MKRRSTLVLLELLIMTVVFALAAVLCLEVFLEADRISQDTRHRDQAVLICENTAETIKIHGDLSAAAQELDAREVGECWKLAVDDLFILEIEALESPVPGMGAALVQVSRRSDGLALFSLTVGYQEVAS